MPSSHIKVYENNLLDDNQIVRTGGDIQCNHNTLTRMEFLYFGVNEQTVGSAIERVRKRIHKRIDHIWYETMRRWREQDINQDIRNARDERLVTPKEFKQQYPLTLDEVFFK